MREVRAYFNLTSSSSEEDYEDPVLVISANRRIKEAVDAVKREKALLKQKRRERDALFKQLSADVLPEIAAAPPPVRNKEVVEQAAEKSAEVAEDTVDYTDESDIKEMQTTVKKNAPDKNRTTVNRFFSVASKTGNTKQAAVHFVDNSWAIEKKRKAEKFKKKWINRQAATGN
ncbi:nucleolar protein 7-like [Protopterus annectens]|uniref:nucleolar protein 7-like n=1 Tax=Protopterus annectens TaxID=7888 RepID=UPI001CFA2ABE|nr:nucleolar protein 7-like [Protopterus annectens]